MREHGREILVTPTLEQRVVRLCLCYGEPRTGEGLGPFELATRPENERLDRRAQCPPDGTEVDRLSLP